MSSGQPPFYADGENYDVGLIYDISQGLRETVVPDTPDEYVKIYTKCWDDNIQLSSDQEFNLSNVEPSVNMPFNINNSELQGELSQLIQNFDKMNTKEIDTSYFVSICYQYGYGIDINENLAFKYFEIIAKQNYTIGQMEVGYCYENGIGVIKDVKKAFNWYKQAAKNGNIMAMHNLGLYYKDGIGVEKNHNKAFELFKQSAERGFLGGMTSLGCCYENVEIKDV
ncbi:kinase-like domain-containing protein [Rhizophagus irregularis DAOM 181602=DAOM 197198]|nr:kinase-like domain-containing protein [Rhizophagus irregularis DAOM 181602=DAOM 197198]